MLSVCLSVKTIFAQEQTGGRGVLLRRNYAPEEVCKAGSGKDRSHLKEAMMMNLRLKIVVATPRRDMAAANDPRQVTLWCGQGDVI